MEQCQETDSLLKSIVNSQNVSTEIKNGGEGYVEIIVTTNEDGGGENQGGDEVLPKEEIESEQPAKKRPKNLLRCRQCDLVFDTIEEQKIHEKETNHKFRTKNKMCSYCGKAFATRDHLNRHVRTHTKEKPYPCNYCEMRFSMVQNLRRHEKLHTGERPFKCDVCGKGFKFCCCLYFDLFFLMVIFLGFIQRTSLKNHKKSTNNGKCGRILVFISMFPR